MRIQLAWLALIITNDKLGFMMANPQNRRVAGRVHTLDLRLGRR